jgi:hypothetical protein
MIFSPPSDTSASKKQAFLFRVKAKSHRQEALGAHMPRRVIVLLHSNAALSAALEDVQNDLEAGSQVALFVFNPRMAKFLEPLETADVKIVPCEHQIAVRVYRFWTWLPQGFRFRRWLNRTFGHCKGCTVRYYNDGFDFPLMGSVAYLARRGGRLFFEDWDHTRATGLDKIEAGSLFLRIFGRLASLISGAPIVMLDPEAPFPCLRPEFYSRYGVECLPKRSVAHLQLADLPVARQLITTTNARIVWLWDDLNAFYGEASVPAKEFFALYAALYEMACRFVPPYEQAVKPHPSLDGKETHVCQGADLLPARVPVEFVRFTAKPVAITVSSYASKAFLNKGFPVISLLHMIKAAPVVIEEAERAINDWLKARDDMFFPTSAAEFSEILQKSIDES